MKMHSNRRFHCLLHSSMMLDRIILDLHRKQFPMHLYHRTFPIVVRESPSIQRSTSNYQLQRSLPIQHGLLDQGEEDISV